MIWDITLDPSTLECRILVSMGPSRPPWYGYRGSYMGSMFLTQMLVDA